MSRYVHTADLASILNGPLLLTKQAAAVNKTKFLGFSNFQGLTFGHLYVWGDRPPWRTMTPFDYDFPVRDFIRFFSLSLVDWNPRIVIRPADWNRCRSPDWTLLDGSYRTPVIHSDDIIPVLNFNHPSKT